MRFQERICPIYYAQTLSLGNIYTDKNVKHIGTCWTTAGVSSPFSLIYVVIWNFIIVSRNTWIHRYTE